MHRKAPFLSLARGSKLVLLLGAAVVLLGGGSALLSASREGQATVAARAELRAIYRRSGGRISRLSAEDWDRIDRLRKTGVVPPHFRRPEPPAAPPSAAESRDKRRKEILYRTAGNPDLLTTEDRAWLAEQRIELPRPAE